MKIIMRKKLSVILMTLLLLSGVQLIFSSDAILMRKSGSVELRPKGKKNFQDANQGKELFFGDMIRTPKGAKAQILFADGNAILLKESSSLKLSGKSGAIQISIPTGEFLIGLKKKLSKGQSFKVKTPAAVAAVRGTLFWGLSDQELNSTYACFQNKLEISAKGKKVILKAGEKTFIPYGQPPKKAEPANVPIEYLDTFEVDGSIEGFKEMLEQK